jgi:hypothetical protein
MDTESMDTEGTDTDGMPPSDRASAEPVAEESAPPLPDDPRVPRRDDAVPWTSKELGGAAPAVGPET